MSVRDAEQARIPSSIEKRGKEHTLLGADATASSDDGSTGDAQQSEPASDATKPKRVLSSPDTSTERTVEAGTS